MTPLHEGGTGSPAAPRRRRVWPWFVVVVAAVVAGIHFTQAPQDGGGEPFSTVQEVALDTDAARILENAVPDAPEESAVPAEAAEPPVGVQQRDSGAPVSRIPDLSGLSRERVDLGGGVTMEMVHCPGVSPDFWMGKCEVTQKQWEQVMGANPSRFKGPWRPVENVSWNDCQEFVRKLNALPSAKASGFTLRLPTEEEWTTACRAGAPESANYGLRDDGVQVTDETLSSVARYGQGWDDGTHDAGSLRPNAWGLHDMHGNVQEWTDTADGDNRVSRGGSFLSTAGYCTANTRSLNRPGNIDGHLGFRLCSSERVEPVPVVKPDASVLPSAAQEEDMAPAESAKPAEPPVGVQQLDSGLSSQSDGPIDLGGGVKLEMVPCPGVAPDFWMGKYEVTQEQWERVMGTDPSRFKGPKKPVENVSWNDCQKFVRKLNALPAAKKSGLTFRLPMEEEWKIACRAGASESADYCLLADGTQVTVSRLPKVARYDMNWADGTADVGSLRPNAWGLYDMHGNVWEWTASADDDKRVYCGGSFLNTAGYCTVGLRNESNPDNQYRDLGFRLAASGRVAVAPAEKPDVTAPPLAAPEEAMAPAESAEPAEPPVGVQQLDSGPSSQSDGLIDLGGGVKLEMVSCPGVAPDFWMGKYEVTQEQWKRVMGTDPSKFKGPKKPVENVSWNDCQEFVSKLNALPAAKKSGLTFRLPSEQEWETACRAGAPKSADYCKLADGTQITASMLSKVAQYGREQDAGTADVGSLLPNVWGLYDMHGNVWEWSDTVVDGKHEVCGGSFLNSAVSCTASDRRWYGQNLSYGALGFRLAASGRAADGERKYAEPAPAPEVRRTARPEISPHQAGDILPVTVAGVSFNLRWCPPGSFLMGSPQGDSETWDNERPQVSVTIPQGFWMGETEVTQGLWRKVTGRNPSSNQSGDEYPVENISWYDCKQFVETLNARSDVKEAGLRFAMPTEAQWEYACRAGSQGEWGNVKGDRVGKLKNMGWYHENSGSTTYSTHPVGKKTPNVWGLYDMHGNVWEWCANVYRSQPTGTLDNEASVRTSGDYRILRGGSSWETPLHCRSARRAGIIPTSRNSLRGFRLLAFQDEK